MDQAIAIAVGIGLILILGLFIMSLNAVRPTAKPTVQHVIDALTGYAYKGVIAGETYALQAEQQLGVQLEGMDKKTIADQIYDTLPNFLMVGPIPLPIGTVKTLVSRSMFEELVENVYQDTQAFLSQNEAYLKSQVDKLVPPAQSPADINIAQHPDVVPAN